jgi:hypothetical protein
VFIVPLSRRAVSQQLDEGDRAGSVGGDFGG